MTAPTASSRSRAAARALVVGVDRYPHLGRRQDLRGAVADARAMAGYLGEVRGFPRDGIRLLLDREATGRAVRAGMEWLVDEARPGEPAVLYFAGHGSWRPDRPRGTRRADGWEKLLLLHDSPHPPRGAGAHRHRAADPDPPFPGGWLGGSFLRPWLERLTARTANVTLILDCCHSGAATRDVTTARVRGVEPADPADASPAAGPPGPLSSSFPGDDPEPEGAAPPLPHSPSSAPAPTGSSPAAAPYVLVAACRSDQRAVEDVWEPDGPPRGLLTGSLLHHLARADQLGWDPSWQDVMDGVAADVASRAREQLPQLEGARDRRLFALGESRQRRYVQVVAREDERVVLAAGHAHRVEPGSEWDVLPGGLEGVAEQVGQAGQEEGAGIPVAGPTSAAPDTTAAFPEAASRQRRGRVVVRSVEATTSHATIGTEEPAPWIGPRDRAVLAALPPTDPRLRVRLQGPAGDPGDPGSSEPPGDPLGGMAAAITRSPFLSLAGGVAPPAAPGASGAGELPRPSTGDGLRLVAGRKGGDAVAGGTTIGGTGNGDGPATGEGDVRVVLLPAGERSAPDRPLPWIAHLPEPRWALADRLGHLLAPLQRVHREGMESVVENLEKIARQRRLLRLCNGASPLAGDLRLEVLRPADGGGWRPAGAEERFRPGDHFALRFCNDSAYRRLFVHVLGLGFGGSITPLYPLPGAWEPLKPGRCLEWGNGAGDPDLRLTLPRGYPYLSASLLSGSPPPPPEGPKADVLKLLVTTEPTDYGLFFQESLRTGEDALRLARDAGADDLARLLGWFVLGSGLRDPDPHPAASAEWTTLERWLWLEA